MLKRYKQYNKGFLGAAKATDKLPYRIICLRTIEPEGRFAVPFNQAGDIVDFGPVYTAKQITQIKELASQGKIVPSCRTHNPYLLEQTMMEVVGSITSASQAEKLGIPHYKPHL